MPASGADNTSDIGVDDFIRRFERGMQAVNDAEDMLTARRRYEALCESFAPPDPDSLSVEDTDLDGVRVRRLRPSGVNAGAAADARGTECVLYIHGGGWSLGSVKSHHGIASDLAVRLEREVISVDYRLSPEADYSQAIDDCHAVVELARPVALVGDSAGARLGLDLARRLGWQPPLGLVYPPVGTPSLETLGPDAPLLTREEVLASWRQVARSVSKLCEARSPAPQIVALAVERDPLTRPFEAAIADWRATGAEIDYFCAAGMVHGALHAHALLPAMRDAWRDYCQALKARLD
ncbi:alpha/beta hydrolase fold domain-containing protein [Halomonas sp. HP20-15]|uniref:alpha/beta hydrolase fold domain-containing protein n=1 Tax=Halomonas sp. HP20-15 TaxID=3085901 RepID=UPI0029823508|nr:alpha/beta hydrolase fold domain-containing protein [Halomonas sp. HP20-15]MDW5377358.1 alpha/beta hydrolase fold domain-containing protein [Halomonas sp. HP20-15]